LETNIELGHVELKRTQSEEEGRMSTAPADWPNFLTKLRERVEIAERTMAFRF